MGSSRALSNRGFSLVEAVISTLILSLVFVGAMRAVAVTRMGQFSTAERLRGQRLAEALLQEILAQPYNTGSSAPGWISSADQTPSPATEGRAAFACVADYVDWSADPPQHPDGSEMTGLAGWERSVEVVFVNPMDSTETLTDDSGMRRVTVTVTHNDRFVARAMGLRSSAGLPEALP